MRETRPIKLIPFAEHTSKSHNQALVDPTYLSQHSTDSSKIMAPNTVPIFFPPQLSNGRSTRLGQTGVGVGGGTSSSSDHILMELPPEIVKLIEQGSESNPLSLTIKGRPSDEAVLCTPNSTYSIRTVQISNELVLLSLPSSSSSSSTPIEGDRIASSGTGEDVFGKVSVSPKEVDGGTGSVSDETGETEEKLMYTETLHELMELTSCVPRLGRIEDVLRGQEWSGLKDRQTRSNIKGEASENDTEDDEDEEDGERPRKRTRYTLAHLRSIIQASDAELDQGLKDRNVIELDGKLLPLPPTRLCHLLCLLLSLLVIHSPTEPPLSAPFALIAPDLRKRGVGPELGEAVMNLFGKVDTDMDWVLDDVKGIVREVGRGLLLGLETNVGIPLEDFMSNWAESVGDAFSAHTVLTSLEGNYLINPPTVLSPQPTLLPFAYTSLPSVPVERFQELFSTRSQWRLADLKPFIRDLSPDEKSLDRLIAKYGRVVKQREVLAGSLSLKEKDRRARNGGSGAQEGPLVEWVYPRGR
ncbi:Uncharacterized conserved protein [Phaffia rhodozyma]|uniref:Uncharacterized conserved protein n=1 Tax=Phaffia rhodozyma TaxID=264483 RepID=A0A0F7SQI0_PHARH|nr:Uncharacterized conserved protein [Phaffia rhodozyma]